MLVYVCMCMCVVAEKAISPAAVTNGLAGYSMYSTYDHIVVGRHHLLVQVSLEGGWPLKLWDI